MYQDDKTLLEVKIIRWYVQSRKQFGVFYGIDKFKSFVSRKWEVNGNRYYNFWDIYSKHPRTAVNYTEKGLTTWDFFDYY